jgi:SM-20-related protein
VGIQVDIAAAASQLRVRGFAVVQNALPDAVLAGLDRSCNDSLEAPFAPAGTGRGTSHQPNASVRGDVIRWLDDARETDHAYLGFMEQLRVGLNEHLFLGLLDYQGHYAMYAPGTHYEKHLDSLAGQKNRLLSTVVYLNTEWRLAEGGELLLYRQDIGEAVARIPPQYGSMVLFLSEEFPHEVLSATRPRHSVAGWFSGRPRAASDRLPHDGR